MVFAVPGVTQEIDSPAPTRWPHRQVPGSAEIHAGCPPTQPQWTRCSSADRDGGSATMPGLYPMGTSMQSPGQIHNCCAIPSRPSNYKNCGSRSRHEVPLLAVSAGDRLCNLGRVTTAKDTQVPVAAVAPVTAGGRRYLPLDGLRALAIGTVLAFHTDGQWLSAGFLGVDVFFVISGYLMAGILVAGHPWNLRSRPVDFWLRRARRLAPALLTVVAAVLAMSILGLVQGGPGLRGDAIAALLYVTNWWALAGDAQYFTQWGSPSPLLQTWSLGIEEQFYIVLPLLLWLLWRMRVGARSLVACFVVLAVASAGWAWSLQGVAPIHVYFGTGTRVQALFIGVVLGLVVARPVQVGDGPTKVLRQSLGWVALAGLLVLMVFAQPWTQRPYAGVLTAAALLSAVLLWAVLECSRSALARMFSWWPLVWVGGISYALYLWHWPVFLWIQGNQDTPLGGQVWAIAVSVVLAWGTTRFIERPIRGVRFSSLPAARQWVTYGVGVAVVAALAFVPTVGAQGGEPSESQWPSATSLPTRLTLFGDSTAYTAAGGFPTSRYRNTQFTYLAPLGCGIRDRRLQQVGSNPAGVECDGWQQRWADFVAWAKPDATVLMENVWELFDVVENGVHYPPGSPEYTAAVSEAVAQAVDLITPPGEGPVYILGVPCHAAGPELNGDVLNDRTRQAALNEILRQVAHTHENAEFIDLAPLSCSSRGPVNAIAGTTLRQDGVHWSNQGRDFLWAYVLQQISDRRG